LNIQRKTGFAEINTCIILITRAQNKDFITLETKELTNIKYTLGLRKPTHHHSQTTTKPNPSKSPKIKRANYTNTGFLKFHTGFFKHDIPIRPTITPLIV